MNEPLYQRTQALLGEEAIEKLKNAKVLICGLGGVGGFTCEALARAGIGTLGLCDMDRVDPTNCNRQILALQSTIGKLKADVAEARVKDINPDVQLRKFALRIDETTIADLDIPSWDYIADCIDGLTQMDAEGAAIPAIAESWDVSDDGMTYTFHLRDDAVWSNGEPVTAMVTPPHTTIRSSAHA